MPHRIHGSNPFQDFLNAPRYKLDHPVAALLSVRCAKTPWTVKPLALPRGGPAIAGCVVGVAGEGSVILLGGPSDLVATYNWAYNLTYHPTKWAYRSSPDYK